MKFSLLLATPAFALGTGNAAIDKIVQMLQDMESRGKKEKQEEQVGFAAFKTWCDNTQAEKEADIKATNNAITRFQAEIEQAQATAQEAQDKIDELVTLQADTTEDLATMKKVRTAEREAYTTEKTDLQDSIYACEKASQALQAVPEKVGAVSSFLQEKLHKRSNRFSAVQSLLETVQQAENPFTAASERKSNVVIEMLDKLKGEFETELQTKTKDEGNLQHNYDMAVQDGHQTVANAKKLQTEKEDVKGSAEAAKGKALKDLAGAEENLKDDKTYLAGVKADCSVKAKDFAARQTSRTEELEAVAQAISILTSEAVTTGAGHLDNAQSVGAFLQLRSNNDAQEKALNFLRSRAASLHSQTLMQLAEVAGADPFVKIRKMVQELITRLEEEAKAELTKKGKCDSDMAENKARIEEFTTQVDKLTSQVLELTSAVADSKKMKKQLETELSTLRQDTNTAKKMRLEEKTQNEKVISESDAALEAIDSAMAVLQNYYSKVKGAFIQEKQPEFAAGSYKGMGGGGVMGLLEVVKAQTAQLIRETKSAESDASNAHSNFMTNSESSKAEKTSLLRSTEQSLAQNKEDLTDKKEALEGPEGARVQLEAYHKEKNEVIDPQCTVQGVSFEERNEKRQQEIQSLTEALEILGQMAA